MSVVAYVCNILIVGYNGYRRGDMFALNFKIFPFLNATIDANVSRNIFGIYIINV